MQFNSYIFMLAFLPCAVLFYYLLSRISINAGKAVIVISGIVFYSFAGIGYSAVLLSSILLNLICLLYLSRHRNVKKAVVIPIIINILLLLFFKYTGFIIGNVEMITGRIIDSPLKALIVPVGISFITFQEISYYRYVIDSDETTTHNPLDYLSFILFFPKILMGPLVEPVVFIEQINDPDLKKPNGEMAVSGIQMFCFGLFKKVLIADTFAKAVSWGFSNYETVSSLEWILVILCYTFEIYFDFSGYSDMAIGIASIFNIRLPINFDSPYKALSIRDFWKRWHITLTEFLTKNIYIPLGGSRKGKKRTYINTMIVFLISGIWHGANWTFILWGILHGVMMVTERVFDRILERIPRMIRWMGTFIIVSVLWLLFRAATVLQWGGILYRIITQNSWTISSDFYRLFAIPELIPLEQTGVINAIQGVIPQIAMWLFLLSGFLICLIPENNYRKSESRSVLRIIMSAIAFVLSFLTLSVESVFVYMFF